MNRKHIAVILMAMATAVTPCHTCAENPDSNAALTSTSKLNNKKKTLSAEEAFNEIAALPGFTALTQEELQERYPERLGSARSTFYGNSDPRDKVLEILDRIPRKMLRAEVVTGKGKITRIYISKGRKGKAEMLYVFIGKGGNDLMATLFTGAKAEVYEHEADIIKQSMEEHRK